MFHNINTNNRRFNSNGSISNTFSLLCLPANPSRVDRLIVDCSKEHSKVVNLVAKMDNLRENSHLVSIQTSFQRWLEGIHYVHAKRQEELINCANRRRMGQPVHLNNDDKGCYSFRAVILRLLFIFVFEFVRYFNFGKRVT